MDYYIVKEDAHDGPYDLVSLIRKIRKGDILSETLIENAGSQPIPAFEMAELQDFFIEMQAIKTTENDTPARIQSPALPLGKLFKDGIEFFKAHQSSTLIVASVMAVMALGTWMLFYSFGGMIGSILSAVWCYLAFSVLQVIILRMARMQMMSFEYVKKILVRYGVEMLISSVVLGGAVLMIPFGLSYLIGPLAFVWMLIPGALLITVFYFTPLLMVDRHMSAFQALAGSLKIVKNLGAENLATLCIVMVANYIVAPTFVLLFVSLPITMAIMSEVYDTNLAAVEA